MQVSDKTMASVVAAFIGAVFLDNSDDRNKAKVAIDQLFDRLFCDDDLLRHIISPSPLPVEDQA